MTLYARYLAEREDFSVIESDLGFASFKVLGDTIYLRDIYVLPEHRRMNVAARLADEVCDVGRIYKCKTLTGSVDPKLASAAESMQALLGYGLRPIGIQGTLVIFEKEL